jgi:hypothetical protein
MLDKFIVEGSATSRRTIAASITKSGMEKLRANVIYIKNSKKKWKKLF